MKIFISYRRDDSADVTGRLFDRLEQHYGAEEVFMDVDTIPLGMDFRVHLSDAVSKCDVLLAIIGERWCGREASGERRIDDPRDFVRIEVESALARQIPVVPVLVGSAQMPTERELPESMKELVFRNATELRSGRFFRQHLDVLIRGLERLAQMKAAGSPAALSRSAGTTNSAKDVAAEPKPPIPTPPPASVPTVEVNAGTSEVFCPQCHSGLTADPAHLGLQMMCPYCHMVFVPIAAVPKCPMCASALLPGAVACMDCGFLVETAALSAPDEAPENPCPNPACGVHNPPDAHFCQRCGNQLSTAIGTMIHNRYRIDKLLAMGGFGSVYLAADTRSADAPVVVKEMLCGDPNEFSIRLAFFRREAEVLELLTEAPAVPRFYELVEQNHNAYLLLEYVQGKDLLRTLEENGKQPFPLDDVIRWGIDICDILTLMHGFNPPWVHRDMKPDNVLLKADGTIKLIDFGTARSLGVRDKADRGNKKEQSEQKKTRVYTEGYAPPEQIVGHPESRSDIFGLAAMLYHLATGKEPEGFYTAKEIEDQLSNGTIPAADRWFYELLKINLAEDLNDRYYSVRWLKNDLKRRKLSTGILCPKCKKLNKLRTPYCIDCNTPLTPKMSPCSFCGTVNRMGSRFCIKCDNRVR